MIKRRKKIGLVLSGGEARGIAHIGDLKVLKEHNIDIDVISGCSMGAFIGAYYSSNMDISEIEANASHFTQRNFVFLSDISLRAGLIKGKKIETYLKKIIKVKDFSELKIPLVINATDLITGEEVIFDKGELIPAVRASIAIPFIFIPKEINGRLLVDGGLINPVPINNIKKYKPDIIIVSNVIRKKSNLHKEKIKFIDVVRQSINIMQSEFISCKKETAKNIIYIDLDVKNTILDFRNTQDIIKIGEKAALEQIDNIKKLIK